MAGRIPQSFIDDLVAATDIVEVIGHYVPLKRAGKEYKACCPFHDEKTPSFTVVPDKQFYHCFGCGAHGTAVGFLMEYANLEFVEAVEELARRTGREVPREISGDSGPRDDLGPVFDALDRANAYYRRQLRRHPQASRAVEYLKGRGLSGKTAAEFQLGFAPPGWDGILRELGAHEPARATLVRAGLLVAGDSGRPYDRFRDRITFPIHDTKGRVTGFGARIIDRGEPKYLNSPETPAFRKGRELYGLWRARRAGRSPKRLLVVEGYMDVVALAQSGIDYAVATLGTAATEAHVQHLFRAVADIVFCFDGDEAGRRAAWRAAENTLPTLKAGRQAWFLFLPEGEDPDSLVRAEGREAFENRIGGAIPLSRFLFDHLTIGVDLSTPEGRARLVESSRPLFDRVPPGPYRRQLSMRLAELSGDASTIAPDRAPTRRLVHPTRHQTSETPVRRAIRMLLHEPSLAAHAGAVAAVRGSDVAGADLLADLVETLHARPDLTTGVLLERFREHQWSRWLEVLAHSEPQISDPEGLREEFVGCLRLVRERVGRHQAQRRLDELKKRHPSELSDEERRELTDLAARRSRNRKSAPRPDD
ncbi:MAG: DNA primase [Thiotrichales bacterium]|nr:DNA primase [Thiotrichales bacterium]